MPEPPQAGMPVRIVDTHVHVACADVERFPLRPTGVGSSWWIEPAGTAVLDDARRIGIDHVVVVQAVGAYGHDSSCARHAVEGAGGFASLVTAPDMSTLAGIDGEQPASGWRLFGVTDGAPWLDDERADIVWRAAAEHRVVLVPTIFTDRLASLRRVVERYPDVPVALDHCAFPDMAGRVGSDMAGAPGHDALLGLADLTGVRLKVSSHVLAAWDREDRLDEKFARLIETFGAQRMCWGSDHPQHEGTYAAKLDLAVRAARHLDPQQRHQFFAGTAAELGWGSSLRDEVVE